MNNDKTINGTIVSDDIWKIAAIAHPDNGDLRVGYAQGFAEATAGFEAAIAKNLAHPEGKALVPVEPTPEIMAAAAIAAWPVASASDIEMAKKAAMIVLRTMTTAMPGVTIEQIAASIATMAPAYRAMIVAAQEARA